MRARKYKHMCIICMCVWIWCAHVSVPACVCVCVSDNMTKARVALACTVDTALLHYHQTVLRLLDRQICYQTSPQTGGPTSPHHSWPTEPHDLTTAHHACGLGLINSTVTWASFPPLWRGLDYRDLTQVIIKTAKHNVCRTPTDSMLYFYTYYIFLLPLRMNTWH